MGYSLPVGPLDAGVGKHGRRAAEVSRRWNHGVRLESLANLAHELRTPTQILLGYLDILRDDLTGEIGGGPREIIERLNISAYELAQTVENVLDFAVAGARAEAEFDDEIELGDLIAEVMPALDAANHYKHLAVEVDLPAEVSQIRARRRPLHAIVLNLAANAIKFTSLGSVAISFRAMPDLAHPQEIELRVRDTGPGIDRSRIETAFARCAQLSSSSRRRYRGMGLGLSVVKRNLEALDATLEVETGPNHGSTFVVRIPIRVRRAIAASAPKAARRAVGSHHRRHAHR
ncbi:MAG: sensor histidine kinase [Candidatus Binataceae bacterium]